MPPNPEVDAYIAAAPPLRRERLSELRALIHRTVPGVAESIEWRMPVFRTGDRYIATVSQKNYLSIYLCYQNGVAAIIAAVPGLKGGKGCLNIGDRMPLPIEQLEPVIRARLAGDGLN